MKNNMEFIYKLPIPKDIKEQYPITKEAEKIREDKNKEIRDIFWPTGLFVLSTTHSKENADKHTHVEGLREGDTLHIRYTTCDEERSQQELDAITKFIGKNN